MSLFKNPILLEEEPSDDFLRRDEEIQRISSKIDWLTKRSSNSISAYIGPFGSGKSTILGNIQKKKSNQYEWINFELWRYSDRNKIWDGFVVELATALDPKDRKIIDIINEIEGQGSNNWIVRNRVKSFVVATIAWFVLSLILWMNFYSSTSELALFIKDILKYGITVLFLIWAFLGIQNILPRTQRPLRRIYELENYLRKVMVGLKKPMVIVIEDIDRIDGEEGVIFLETLRNFLKSEENHLPKSVAVIAPQDSTAFDIVNNNSITGFQRSLKIYDYEFYYTENDLWVNGLDEYLKKLGASEANQAELKMAIESIAAAFSKQMTMRLAKRLLRIAYEFIESYQSANPTVALSIAALKYIRIETRDQSQSAATIIKRKSSFESPPIKVFANILKNIAKEEHNIRDFDITFDSQDDEIKIEVVTHPNGDSDGHIVLDEKYSILL